MSRAVAQRQHKAKVRLAVGFGALGIAILGAPVWMPWQTFPDPFLWAAFAAAFVYLRWHTVEVTIVSSPVRRSWFS